MKKILFIVVCAVCLCGCSNDNRVTSNKAISGKDEHVTTNIIIIDVRSEEEYKEEHVKGAINIPYDTIDDSIDLPKNSKLQVYCKSGKRSKIAYETLKELGYDVEDLGAYVNVDLPKE